MATVIVDSEDEGYVEAESPEHGGKGNGLPPQTVLARVLRELEDDFEQHKT